MKRSVLHRLAAALGVAALTVSLAACGGSDDTKSLTDEGFRTQANALCTTANADLKALQGQLPSASTEAAGDALAEKIADRIDKLVSDVLSLPAPADLRPGVVKLLDTVTGVSKQIHTDKLAFYKNLKTDPFAEADVQSRALGLNACAGD